MPGKEEASGNTVCIGKADDAVRRKKARTELAILIGISIITSKE